MSASYPTSIVTTATLLTVAPGAPRNNPSHVGQHDNLNAEVIAIETALGSGITNTYATAVAWMTTLGTLVTAAQTTATAAQTTATSAIANALAAQTTATAAIPKATYTASGDLVAGTGAGTYVKIALGTNGQFLVAQSTATGGVAWSTQAITAYPGAGIAVSTGTNATAWASSYSVGTASSNIIQLNSSAQIPAITGIMQQVAAGSVTAGTAITVSGLSSSARYQFVMNIIWNGTGGYPFMTMNADGGNNYNWCGLLVQNTSLATGGGSGVAFISLTSRTADTVAISSPWIGKVDIYGNGNNSQISYRSSCITTGGIISLLQGAGAYTGSAGLTSLTIKPSAGSFTGTWIMYSLN